MQINVNYMPTSMAFYTYQGAELYSRGAEGSLPFPDCLILKALGDDLPPNTRVLMGCGVGGGLPAATGLWAPGILLL